MADDVAMTAWLADFLARHGGTSGTVHLVDGDVLRLVAAINIPPPVRAVTTVIPRGKGMAGLAWERAHPLSTCNLQTDATGDIRPGARAVAAAAAIAFPLGAPVAAIVGIAWPDDRTLDDATTLALIEDAGDDFPAA